MAKRKPTRPVPPDRPEMMEVGTLAVPLDELTRQAQRLYPAEDAPTRAVEWTPAEPLSPLGLYFNHLAGPGHRACWTNTEHIQIIDCAQGTGKTTELLCEATAFFLNCHPTRKRTRPVSILVIAPSRFQLATIYGERLLIRSELHCPPEFAPELARVAEQPMLPMTAVKAKPTGMPMISWTSGAGVRGPSLIVHEDGSRLFFAISGVPNSWKHIESQNFDAIFRDEGSGNSVLGATLRTRLRQSWDDPAITGGGFYKWYFSELEPTAETMDAVKRAKRGDDYHVLLEFKPSDNRAVSMASRVAIGSTMSKADAEQRMLGTSKLFDSLMIFANQMDRKRHILAEHHEPSERANILVSWDPGMRHPDAVTFYCIEPEKPSQLICFAALLESGATIDQVANNIHRILDGRFVSRFVYDPAGAPIRERSNGQKRWEMMDEALRARGVKLKQGMEPGVNNYETTFTVVWRYLNPDPKRPDAEPLLVFNPPNPQAPGIEEVIDGMYRYQWKNAANRGLNSSAVVNVDDDCVSSLRYLLCLQPKYIDYGPNPRRNPTRLLTGLPIPPPLRPLDPLADDPSLSEGERRNREMLRASRDMAKDWRRRSQSRAFQPHGQRYG